MPIDFYQPTEHFRIDKAMFFGEGLNILDDLAEEKINPTFKPGGGSGLFFKIIGFFKKSGFEIYKVSDSIEISPMFPAYQTIIKEKEQINTQIKQHLASIATAIADVELVKHDLRKYKEFMDYFKKLEKGKELIKQGKIEEGRKIFREADQSLRSVFIDQVDVHTGETIALKLIAPRWPTIISDFMRLNDEDTEIEKIKKKYNLPEAEAVVLATKNKLYLEWRDKLFGPAVKERFRSLVSLVEMRKKSVEEYKNMIRPLIARYSAIKEMTSPQIFKVAAYKPAAQAFMLDNSLLYAWRPVLPKGVGKGTRVMFENIRAGLPSGVVKGVGFFDDEIEFIKSSLRKKLSLSNEESLFLTKTRLESLPVEPSIDNVVRTGVKLIENTYGVKFTPLDFFNARFKLLKIFKDMMSTSIAETWPYSGYYAFLEIPFERLFARLPNGAEMEDITIDLKVYLKTQNIILLHYLELQAIEETQNRAIKQMLGELGVSGEEIDEIVSKELGEEIKKTEINIYRTHYTFWQKFKKIFADLFFNLNFDYPLITRLGPYENINSQQLKKYILPEVLNVFRKTVKMLKNSIKVPS